MSLSITPFRITRNIRTKVFVDPDQYDTENNTGRGLHLSKITHTPTRKTHRVTKEEVVNAQNFWAQSIVDISSSFLTGGDYVKLAGERAEELYGYEHSNVLFKPTKASKQQFRPTANDAMSYFWDMTL